MFTCKICGKEIYEKQSHLGYCEDCMKLVFKDKEKLKDLLDNLQLPVMAINSKDTKIITANEDLLQFVNKSLDEVAGQLGGDVMDCVYADEPGGCGQTYFCSDCPIRNAVLKTVETKIPQKDIDVEMLLLSGDKSIKTRLNISTKIKDETILLQINDYYFLDW